MNNLQKYPAGKPVFKTAEFRAFYGQEDPVFEVIQSWKHQKEPIWGDTPIVEAP
jgi:hypothetical protein